MGSTFIVHAQCFELFITNLQAVDAGRYWRSSVHCCHCTELVQIADTNMLGRKLGLFNCSSQNYQQEKEKQCKFLRFYSNGFFMDFEFSFCFKMYYKFIFRVLYFILYIFQAKIQVNVS